MLAIMETTRKTGIATQDELIRLKRYLQEWAGWASGAKVGKGLPSRVPFVELMKPSIPHDYDSDEKPDLWVCSLIEAALFEITGKMPLARAALSVRYMNVRGPSVYRSGRLTALSPAECDELADSAEQAIAPIAKRRGLPL